MVVIMFSTKGAYFNILYINSLRLSVCDRAWEGAGWAQTGHGHGRDWAWTRHGLGTGMVTGGTGHGTGHGLDTGTVTGTGHGLGTDWARARAGWARADCVRTSQVPTSFLSNMQTIMVRHNDFFK
jgi:hypothetical protein